MSSRDGTSCCYQRGPQRRAWNTKAATTATKKPVCKNRSLSTLPLPGACAAHHCQGPTIKGQFPRRTHGMPQAVAMSCWPLPPGSPRIPYPSLPPASVSQSPLISCSLTLSCLGGNRCPQATYMQRWGQTQSWTPGAVRTKKRKGNFSQQPQEQQIKSPQSTWCTLHLWNTWIDNKSS